MNRDTSDAKRRQVVGEKRGGGGKVQSRVKLPLCVAAAAAAAAAAKVKNRITGLIKSLPVGRSVSTCVLFARARINLPSIKIAGSRRGRERLIRL